ncbi:MAG: ribonuclease R [Acetobacteraceae bacterium]
MARRKGGAAGAPPSRDQVRAFIAGAAGRVGKREIAREFGLGPEHKAELRAMLDELSGEGVIAPAGHRRFAAPGRLPDATVVRVTGTDPDGDAVARPVDWQGDGPPPIVLMHPERRDSPALAPGERVLARLIPIGGGKYEGRTIKRLSDEPGRILGVFEPAKSGGGGRVQPTDRRAKADWRVPPGEEDGAEAGEIVLATPLPHAGLGLKPARVVERLGRVGDARSVSLICIHTLEIPTEFSEEALAAAARARGVPLGKREDLRGVPLVTIDGEDARDFDDAVFAEPDGNGHRLIVAIADVAHYVRPGLPLDRSAWTRGNSVYFPDRVVPMLPEALSNGWCSLRPAEDRGCLFVEMRVDASGRKTGHRFGRGLMRSAARLTYTQVQAAHDAGDTLGLEGAVGHLYAAFRALLGARQARGTLDLDLPERQVILRDGKVEEVRPRPRLDAHRLIEEFMVLANVAAAEELERLHRPCMYRIHAPPSEEKLEALRTFLHGLGLSLPPGDQLHPRDLDQLLQKVAGTDEAGLVNEVVLRSQSQAAYSPDNIGHFGLALPRYAHFTSPIRRYADLLVHRALVSGLNLGLGGLGSDEAAKFAETAEHISATERRAAQAERDAIDRYLAAFMADKVGSTFRARISGVQRFGVFVTLMENGASGLVPMSGLPDDYWIYEEATQSLSGRRTRMSYHLAQEVEVRLTEASPLTGGMIFRVLGPERQRPERTGPERTGQAGESFKRGGPERVGKPHRRR